MGARAAWPHHRRNAHHQDEPATANIRFIDKQCVRDGEAANLQVVGTAQDL